jgi:uncharacterized Ntn-hydrolase superfamily protein
MVGIAITTSSICVGSRCPWVRAGVGAVATQNVTLPSLGNEVLDEIESGLSAQEALDKVTKGREHSDYRQLTVVDSNGNSAHFTGSEILGTNDVSTGVDCVAAGNLLANKDIPTAMTDYFQAYDDMHLAERLLRALQAGHDAGGEMGPTHSAALLVAHEYSWPLVDLRVDWHDEDPIKQLESLWEAYEPQMQDYITRAIDPPSAPSYGVPGDE